MILKPHTKPVSSLLGNWLHLLLFSWVSESFSWWQIVICWQRREGMLRALQCHFTSQPPKSLVESSTSSQTKPQFCSYLQWKICGARSQSSKAGRQQNPHIFGQSLQKRHGGKFAVTFHHFSTKKGADIREQSLKHSPKEGAGEGQWFLSVRVMASIQFNPLTQEEQTTIFTITVCFSCLSIFQASLAPVLSTDAPGCYPKTTQCTVPWKPLRQICSNIIWRRTEWKRSIISRQGEINLFAKWLHGHAISWGKTRKSWGRI